MKICIISRGYGRKTRERQLVSDGTSVRVDAATGGDEPVMLAHTCPGAVVIADKDRAAAIKWALHTYHPDLFLLDDAFQHRRVYRDLDIVTLRSCNPLGNGMVLPAGPLREARTAMNRASLLWFNGGGIPFEADDLNPHVPQISAVYDIQDIVDRKGNTYSPDLSGKKVVAFCGLANPQSFRQTLHSLNADILYLASFNDHHLYSEKDMIRLYGSCQGFNTDLLVTTEKDWYKLPPSPCDPLLRCVRVRLKVDDPIELEPVVNSLV